MRTSTSCLLGAAALAMLADANVAGAADGDAAAPAAGAAVSPNPKYVVDEDSMTGDHLTVFVNIDKAVEHFDRTAPPRCVPAGAKMKVIRQSDQEILVRMLSVPQKGEFLMTDLKNVGIAACGERTVNLHTVYAVRRSDLLEETYKRTGATFGALVVPFKFRVTESKELSSSATLAPYVGARLDWLQGFGFSLTPIFSAGLALVPITDQTNNTTTTKAAPSIGVGLILTSSKNNQFNAGILFGKDLVSRADRMVDPRAYENWISFYIGTSK